MSGAEPGEATALFDAEGRLLHADPPLGGPNHRAGGDVGEPLALPPLAALVRLARRLGIAVDRRVTIGDDGDDVVLWATAEPVGDRVRLRVRGRDDGEPGGDAAAAVAGGEAIRWECDPALRLVRLSDAARAIGIDAGLALGRPVAAILGGDDPSSPVARALERRRGFAGVALAPGIGAAMLADGEPIRDAGGRFAGFTGQIRPATAAAVAERVADPAAPFVAGLDRALRRPLSRIIANADSIHGATDGPVAPDYAGYAADIAHAGRHLLSLVDDLVDVQAVERDDFVAMRDPVDLADVARRAAGLLAVRATEAGVAIERPLPGIAAWSVADVRRTLQIVVNLMTNAVRYAPRGTIVLVGLEPPVNGRVGVTIADEGKGIAPVDQARVFKKFERVDTSEPGGSGLGLYISRRLARAMGGDLVLASEAGAGARFTLWLPTASAAQSPPDQDQH